MAAPTWRWRSHPDTAERIWQHDDGAVARERSSRTALSSFSMADVLVVLEPSHPAAGRLLAALDAAGHDVRVVERAREAEQVTRSAPFHAVLFDHDLVGLDVPVRLRRDHPAHTLIAWSRSSSSAAVTELLEAGIDEVVHGGMSEREAEARILAALRRSARTPTVPVQLGPLWLDALHGEATWDGRALGLTRREREVLLVLAQAPGRTVRRETIYRQVWGYTMARGDRSVDVNVRRLREKLAAAGADVEIATQLGVGYRLELPTRVAAAEGAAL